jgi:SAM-dependent methyltransferase
MSVENEKTLNVYEAMIAESIAYSNSFQAAPELIKWLDASLEGLAFQARILEIGSSSGRDATYIRARGYKVTCSDALSGFVDHLKQQGHDALQLNLLTDPIAQIYDLIIAAAVLVHFTRAETEDALTKIFNALSDQGRLSLTLKIGIGEEWAAKNRRDMPPRYFSYWQEDDIRLILAQVGFRKIYIEHSLTPVHPDAWLFIRAIKD